MPRDGWRRRWGVLYRPTIMPFVPSRINDGGDDAPLTPRGRLLFAVSLAVVVVTGVGLIVVTRLL